MSSVMVWTCFELCRNWWEICEIGQLSSIKKSSDNSLCVIFNTVLLPDTDALIDESLTVTEYVLIIARFFLDPSMMKSVLLSFSLPIRPQGCVVMHIISSDLNSIGTSDTSSVSDYKCLYAVIGLKQFSPYYFINK